MRQENWSDGQSLGGWQIVDDGTGSLIYQTFDGTGAITLSRPATADEQAAYQGYQAAREAISAQQQATATITSLANQVQANVTQAQADAAAWPSADAATRDEIMGRVLVGLATITGALGELGVHLGIGQ